MVRAYAASCAAHNALMESSSPDNSSEFGTAGTRIIRNHTEYYDAAKEYVRDVARKEIARMQKQDTKVTGGTSATEEQPAAPYPFSDVTSEMKGEEAGYLGVHLLFVPIISTGDHSDNDDEDYLLPPESVLKIGSNRRRERKRYRGNDPTNKQGGDPKVNLVKRVKNKWMGGENGAWNMERNDIQRILDQVDRQSADLTKKRLAKWIVGLDGSSDKNYSTHAAVWRKPFHVSGKYTKARRDVSQTPFYVPDGPGGTMIKKGLSSVEEEICPVLAKIGCGEISKENNEMCADNDVTSEGGSVVYGMCKFHASGREDIDVRMLLPPAGAASNRCAEEEEVGGRPFVCEVIDAHRMPSPYDLTVVTEVINRVDTYKKHLDVTDIIVDAGIASPNRPVSAENGERRRRYGCNPDGVDVACMSYCTSSSFKGLQAETENKVKHYGCAVWCEEPIKSQEELDARLGVAVPVKIYQSTPLRVLHRRASGVRTRHVLTLSARLVNEHWFALHLSTSAGTYVKEFVHGDCGRTKPSISSMLGCKTDILRLDCEGIAM